MGHKVLVWGLRGVVVGEEDVDRVKIQSGMIEKENIVAWTLDEPKVEKWEKTVWEFGNKRVVWLEQFVLRGNWEEVENAIAEIAEPRFDVVKVYVAEVRERWKTIAEVRSDAIWRYNEIEEAVRKMLRLLKSRV